MSAARWVCLVRSIATAVWQLRHSSESFAFSRAHSCSATSRRRSRNFCRVVIVPNRCPHTSLDACILRAILLVQPCGTWQSEQTARTPERLEKCTVCDSSSYRFARISWHERQNGSVLVASSAVLKPPQNITPQAKPPSV